MTTHEVRSVEVEIAVPVAFAWEVLLDYPSYPLWNPFTVRVESTCLVGDPIDLYLPHARRPDEVVHQREWIVVNDPPRHFAYEMRETEELPVGGRRDQFLDPTGPASCRYWTTDVFLGPYADEVMRRQGPWVKAGLDGVARALTSRAELLWNARS